MPGVIIAGQLQILILYKQVSEEILAELNPCLRIMSFYMKRREWGSPMPDAMNFDEYVCSPIILPDDWNPPFVIVFLHKDMTPEDFAKLSICREKESIVLCLSMTHLPEVEAQCDAHRFDFLMPKAGQMLSEHAMQAFFHSHIPQR